MLGGQPPLEEITDGQERCGPSDRPVFRKLSRQLAPTLLRTGRYAMEPERALHRPAGHRVDTDGDADLKDSGAAFAQRPLTPCTHGRKNRVISRVIGGPLLSAPVRLQPVNRDYG